MKIRRFVFSVAAILIFLGCSKMHDYAGEAEGTYFLEREAGRRIETRDILTVKKIDPSHIGFTFKVFASTSSDYVDEQYEGMVGRATLKNSGFIYPLLMKSAGDNRKCFLEFAPEKDGIDLRITKECESWHSPNGKWIKNIKLNGL